MSEDAKVQSKQQQQQQQQAQLQQLTHLLVNAITQQQQQQYASQVQQLLNAVSFLQNNGNINNVKDEHHESTRESIPVSAQVQAAQLAAAAVTAKHKHVASNNHRNGPNACTVQCIDPVTRRTVLYRPGGTSTGPATPVPESGNSQRGSSENSSSYTYDQNASSSSQQQYLLQQLMYSQMQQQQQQHHTNQHNNGDRNASSSFHQQHNNRSWQYHQYQQQQNNNRSIGPQQPIGSNRPSANSRKYYDQYHQSQSGQQQYWSNGSGVEYNNNSDYFSDSMSGSGRGHESPSHSPSPTPSDNEDKKPSGKIKVTNDDNDILSELNRQIDLICFS